MEFFSHTDPDKKLITHLMEVAQRSEYYGDPRFAKAHRIIGYAHDFGKYTTYFQDRLFKRKDWGEKANHACISAIFGAYLCRMELGEKASFLPLWAFSSILSHHGDIKEFYSKDYLIPLNSNSIYRRAAEEKLELLQKQVQNMRKNLIFIEKDFELIGLEKKVCSFLIDPEAVPDTLKYLKDISLLFEDHPEQNAFWIHQNFYSCLIAADKMSAGRVAPVKELISSIDILQKQKEFMIAQRVQDRLAPMRKEIFAEVQKNLEERCQNDKFFSITAPTGTGKTFTGLFAAKKLQEQLGNRHKIIYALPFTSIIEQNYNVICQLHSIEEDFSKNESRYIIKHHHLSNMEYKNEDEDYRKDQSELLIEHWDSGIIVTTFVQLLETLIGDRNRMLKKYHVLTNSILLLDEVQAIPLEYFKLIDFAFRKLTEVFDCRIILMTATKPMLFDSAQELLKNSKVYFSKMKRTFLSPDMNKITVKTFCNDFLAHESPEKSYLIVANTIAQSLEIYENLSKTLPEGRLYYLSTNLLPLHRKNILEQLTELMKKGEKIILVSTQVVEAGVDLDFDEVIRDLGPLDSIIQCAGRCNRNAVKDVGKVKVVYMVDEKGASYAVRVYGSAIINIAEELLQSEDKIDESQYGELIDSYYSKVCGGKISMQESENLIKAIQNMNFDKETGIGSFSLIKENKNYLDLFIEFDDRASKLLKQFEEALYITDEQDRRSQIKDIRKNMLLYTISIPAKYASRYQPRSIGSTGLLVLDSGNVPRHYNIKTGLKRNEEFDMLCF